MLIIFKHTTFYKGQERSQGGVAKQCQDEKIGVDFEQGLFQIVNGKEGIAWNV